MELSLRYISQFACLHDAKLLAGADGLDRSVKGCDILDYELDRSLNGKYSYSNFSAERLVLTSFQFAKDNAFLIDEAIKHCISANASGLVIRNVYDLPIHDYTLRYADSKRFPIFLLENRKAFFEDIIVRVDRCISHAEYAAQTEANLARLLTGGLDRAEKERVTAQLFPAFHQSYVFFYIKPASDLSENDTQKLCQLCAGAVSEDSACAVLPYRGSLFLFCSGDRQPELTAELLAGSSAGCSARHHYPAEVDLAMAEAMDAAAVHGMKECKDSLCLRYEDIGIYRALLPLRMDERLNRYAHTLLEPLMTFDAENRAALLDTVLELVQCGGDLHQLSERRGEHENTLRNRLEKVRALTGLGYRKPEQYEELALAARVLMLERV